MGWRALIPVLGLSLMVGCKMSESDSSTSASGSNQTSAGAKKNASPSEQCGTVLMKGADIVFQVTGDNSENNIDHILDPQDGASAHLLHDMATKITQACITAEFNSSGRPVVIKSASLIREVK